MGLLPFFSGQKKQLPFIKRHLTKIKRIEKKHNKFEIINCILCALCMYLAAKHFLVSFLPCGKYPSPKTERQ